MTKIFFSIGCLIIVSFALHVQLNHQATLIPGKVNIRDDLWFYLARCNNCGDGAYPDSACVCERNRDYSWAIWQVQKVGDKFAFKSDTGQYLARCNGCWSNAQYSDSAFVHVPSLQGNPWALWTVEDVGKFGIKRWTIKADNGKYLDSCFRCVQGAMYSTFAFPNRDYGDFNLAYWTIIYRFPTGRIRLQADTGAYLSRCDNCGNGNYSDSASIHETDPQASTIFWSVQMRGDQVALKSETGKYLALCHNCWVEGAYPDSAFVYVDTFINNYQALWTPFWIGNGNWGLQGSNGKYLARCGDCVPNAAYLDLAFVHSIDPVTQPYAQWKITNV